MNCLKTAGLCAVLSLSACGPGPEAAGSRDRTHSGGTIHGFIAAQPEQSWNPRYPVVLHHGFLGFDEILGIDYFYGVEARLLEMGVEVFTTRVSPVNSISYRAGQLAGQIQAILRRTGAAKVNIIAHSMGGLDGRYMISTMGLDGLVASLTSVATPHRGSPVADIAANPRHPDSAAMKAVLREVTGTDRMQQHSGAAEPDLDLDAALHDLTTAYVTRTFNAANPDRSTVFYQSWSGRSSLTGLSTGDVVEVMIQPTWALVQAREGDNDGLVSERSAAWGTWRGSRPADHINMVGHPFGMTSLLFDHQRFYEDIVRDLVRRGF